MAHAISYDIGSRGSGPASSATPKFSRWAEPSDGVSGSLAGDPPFPCFGIVSARGSSPSGPSKPVPILVGRRMYAAWEQSPARAI